MEFLVFFVVIYYYLMNGICNIIFDEKIMQDFMLKLRVQVRIIEWLRFDRISLFRERGFFKVVGENFLRENYWGDFQVSKSQLFWILGFFVRDLGFQ